METTRVINPAVLIEEVKKNPILYDLRNSHSSQSLDQKRKSWEMVAATLCGARWHSYDEMEKEGIAKEIQLKWKNLRDNFTRILRKEKEDEVAGNTSKRKKYIYYDQLMFLSPYTSFRKKPSNDQSFRSTPATDEIKTIKEEVDLSGGRNANNIIFINETRDSNDSEEDTSYQLTTTTADTPSSIATPINSIPFQLIQLQSTTNGSPSVQSATDIGSVVSNERVVKALEKLLQGQQEQMADDAMGNRKFLLSLQPFLQKLPDDVNLEVRLQIMSVLQSYCEKGAH